MKHRVTYEQGVEKIHEFLLHYLTKEKQIDLFVKRSSSINSYKNVDYLNRYIFKLTDEYVVFGGFNVVSKKTHKIVLLKDILAAEEPKSVKNSNKNFKELFLEMLDDLHEQKKVWKKTWESLQNFKRKFLIIYQHVGILMHMSELTTLHKKWLGYWLCCLKKSKKSVLIV